MTDKKSKIQSKLDKIKNPAKRQKVESRLLKGEGLTDSGESDASESESVLTDVLKSVSQLFDQAAKTDDPEQRRRLKEEALELLQRHEEPCEPEAPTPDTYPAPVPRTGQTTCWDSHYQEVDCDSCDAAPGQDGAVPAGVPWPEPRFKDNCDGTVTDGCTGLIWLKDADSFGEVTWDQARMLAAKLQGGCYGLTDGSRLRDWRLPTIRELFSIVDYGQAAPIVPADYPARETVKPAIYWTSTTLLADPTQAWMMTLGIGPTVFMLKNSPNRMWPVRDGKFTIVPKSGQTQTFGFEKTGQDGLAENRTGVKWPERRFESDANGIGTVTDNLTGLVWLQNANAFGWQTWEQALLKCNSLHSGSIERLNDGSKQGQWRLPNVREIESLVDYGRAGPCLPDGWREAFRPDQDSPPSVQPSSYWTSTTVAGAPSEAMFIILGIGPVIFENKEHPFFVWPVRNQI
ncbi:MAG TPA: DUF1566 domain-containing protein [Pirellulaceae bacterium]|nr:DUF1566 domain-containing protein [Pirellulaceae bacterium]